MTRRTQWQYAVLLQRNPFGHVDQAIGKNVATGNTGLIAPNRLVSKDFEEITLDGVTMVFQNAPDTEAPVEMNTYFPQFKALWSSEIITGTIHNIYTIRGAAVRNALNWSKEINEALYKFGQEAEVMFASHSWPRWGNERIQEVLRDAARRLRQPQQPDAALRQPGRDDQRDPERLRSAEEPAAGLGGA